MKSRVEYYMNRSDAKRQVRGQVRGQVRSQVKILSQIKSYKIKCQMPSKTFEPSAQCEFLTKKTRHLKELNIFCSLSFCF